MSREDLLTDVSLNRLRGPFSWLEENKGSGESLAKQKRLSFHSEPKQGTTAIDRGPEDHPERKEAYLHLLRAREARVPEAPAHLCPPPSYPW